MNTELLMQSLNSGFMISIIGMGVVLCFLTLMMGVMKVNEKILFELNKLFPEEIKAEPAKKAACGAENEIAVAIAAARNFFAKGGN